jgi:hypothetical protein
MKRASSDQPYRHDAGQAVPRGMLRVHCIFLHFAGRGQFFSLQRQSAFAPARCSSRLSQGSIRAAPLTAASRVGWAAVPEDPATCADDGTLYVRPGGSAVGKTGRAATAVTNLAVRAAYGQEVALDLAVA